MDWRCIYGLSNWLGFKLVESLDGELVRLDLFV